MDADTLKALKGSIAKWQSIVKGKTDDQGMDNCPLCERFAYQKDECRGCPVRERTGIRSCMGTPYQTRWSKLFIRHEGPLYADTPEKVAAAQAELDFLKSFLPSNK